MASAILSSRLTRVVSVVTGAAAAYVGLAILVYWAYFTIGDSIYDRTVREGTDTVQALFYVALAVHLLGSLSATLALTIWTNAPFLPTLALSAIVLGIFVLFTLGALTGANFDHYDIEFPVRGWANR